MQVDDSAEQCHSCIEIVYCTRFHGFETSVDKAKLSASASAVRYLKMLTDKTRDESRMLAFMNAVSKELCEDSILEEAHNNEDIETIKESAITDATLLKKIFCINRFNSGNC